MSDVTDLVPCPACGAWPGEPCLTLYTKDGSPAGKPTAGHHMARCMLWHMIKYVRGESEGWSKLRRGTAQGCYYDIRELALPNGRHRDQGEVVHSTPKDTRKWMAYNLSRAVAR